MSEQTQTQDLQQEHQKYIEEVGDWTRTHSCGQLTEADDGAEVCLMGWAQYRRDHGGLIFVDLRDREGLTQVVFSPEIAPKAHEDAHILRAEYVLAIKGSVRPRPEGMTNPNLVTGGIEVVVKEWKLEAWEGQILDRWNEINLYSMTRGINRFLALAMALEEINESLTPVEGVEELSAWVKEADELSNGSVQRKAEESGLEIFQKALAWSKAVNQSISELPEETKKPFEGVVEGLKAAHGAQNVGGKFRLIFPDGGAGDLGTGVVAVAEQGDEHRVDVLGQDVRVVVIQFTQRQLVLYPQNQPGFLQREVGGDLQLGAHHAQQLGHRDARVLQQLGGERVGSETVHQGGGLGILIQFRLSEDGFGSLRTAGGLRMREEILPQGLPGVRQGLHVGHEPPLLNGGKLIHRIGKGLDGSDGQVVHPGHALGLAQPDQPQDRLVFVVAFLQEAGIEGQAVGGAVGHHRPAAAVGDDAPGGLHFFLPGDGADGLSQIFIIIVDLGIVQDPQV